MVVRRYRFFRNGTPGSPGPGDLAATDRRSALRLLGASIAAVLFGRGSALAEAANRGGGALPYAELSNVERQAARLGERFAAENPRGARRLLREVNAQLATTGPRATSERVARARRVLLDPEQLAREFENGESIAVAGWPMARSELAFCVFLHGIDDRTG